MEDYEIIVWVKGRTNGHVFVGQSQNAVGHVTKAAQTGDAVSLNIGRDKFMVFAKDSISHFQVTTRKFNG